MYVIRLDARQCVSCGICADVCDPRALRMRVWRGRTVEGVLSDRRSALRKADAGTFPYLADPARCDGCLACVEECPVRALALFSKTTFGAPPPGADASLADREHDINGGVHESRW